MALTQPPASGSASRELNANAAAVSHIEDALTTRLLPSAIHALELYTIYLGKEAWPVRRPAIRRMGHAS